MAVMCWVNLVSNQKQFKKSDKSLLVSYLCNNGVLVELDTADFHSYVYISEFCSSFKMAYTYTFLNVSEYVLKKYIFAIATASCLFFTATLFLAWFLFSSFLSRGRAEVSLLRRLDSPALSRSSYLTPLPKVLLPSITSICFSFTFNIWIFFRGLSPRF